jgi:hypothetical protein
VVVLSHEHRRGGGTRLVALTPGQDVVRLGADDFDGPPHRAATIELPQPFAPRNPSFRKHAAERLRRVKVHDDRAGARREERRKTELEAQLAAHPLNHDRAREGKLRAAAAVERIERDMART